MNHPFKILFYSTIVLLISCAVSPKPNASAPRFVPSRESIFKIPKDQTYTFGYLEVPENRNQPAGPIIRLPVYIFKSRSENSRPDPVLYTVGGPGNTSMRAAQYMNYYQYLDDRDLILFEQRGTTYAQPHLDCPEWAAAVYRANLPGVTAATGDSLRLQAAAACRDRLQGKGIDLNAYHTNVIAADIEDLRKVLGIKQYNLLTISYSTKIAQVLMRDYPETIRSVVMDSPLPLEFNYDEESNVNLLNAFDKLLDDCAADPDCEAAFPKLKNRFYQFLENRSKDPLKLEVKHPEKEKIETFYLRGRDLIALLGADYTGDVPDVPLHIEGVLSGNYGSIIPQLQDLLRGPGDGAGMGMRLSVWCAEETAFASRENIRLETEKYPAIKGLSPAVFSPEVCDVWGVTPLGERENQAVRSDIPTLLISGEYDNATPPEPAAQMQQYLSNSYHIVFKGWCHTPTTYWSNPCGMAVANAFFNNPGQKPDLECLQQIKTPRFKTK